MEKFILKIKGSELFPLTKKEILGSSGQYRYTLNEFHWEIPEGGGPLDEFPLLAAQRELKEETGISAKKWTALLRMNPSNSVSDEECIIYLAEDLEYGESLLEETEADLKVKKIPLTEAIDMVMRGYIRDSMSMIGLLMLARMRGL